MPTPRPTEDQFLGVLLGLAIGDALGMPVAGLSAEQILAVHGRVEGYLPRRLDDGTEVAAGEITDETETTLCIVESLTTNDGLIDPPNIAARLNFLAATESRRWLSPRTLAGLEAAADDALLPSFDSPEIDVTALIRGVPAGLMHIFGAYDVATLRGDADLLTRLTHGGGRQAELSAAVATATRLAVLQPSDPDNWAATIGEFTNDESLERHLERPPSDVGLIDGDDAGGALVVHAVAAAAGAGRFEDAVVSIVAGGGAADTGGALAGALAGGRFGASGIPQTLIDGLGARIYLSLAAPWLYRTMLRRAGTVIDLRPL